MADEEGLRRQAVRRRIAGESEAAVAADLGRSRRWVRKWLARYHTDPARGRWFVTRDRAPATSPQQTPSDVVELVVEARHRLDDDPRAQRGAAAIAWQLAVMGLDPEDIPPARTIERIVSQAGLARPRRARGDGYVARGVPYPRPARHAGPGQLHEVDPVGPRWLHGAQEVHSLNVMDVGTHRVALEPLPRQRPLWLAQRLLAAWQRLGLPQVVQLDNHASLRGAINNPRRFGPVVTTAVALGVVPRFVPLSEPWRQGAIEHFQDVFDTNFFRAEQFTDLDHLIDRAHTFEAFHNARHRYTPLDGATPDQATVRAGLTLRRPPSDFQVPDRLPDHGRIEAIRFIRSDRILNLFNEQIRLPEAATYRYVTATIFIADSQLIVTDTDGQILLRRHHQLA